MPLPSWTIVFPFLAIAYGLALLPLFRKREVAGQSGRFAILYGLVAILLNLAAFSSLVGLPTPEFAFFAETFTGFAPVALSALLLIFAGSYLRRQGMVTPWLIAAVFPFLVALVVDLGQIGLEQVGWPLTWGILSLDLRLVAWGLLIVATTLVTLIEHRQNPGPLYRNRANYLITTLPLLAWADLLAMHQGSKGALWGEPARLLMYLILSHAACSYRPVVLRLLWRRAISYGLYLFLTTSLGAILILLVAEVTYTLGIVSLVPAAFLAGFGLAFFRPGIDRLQSWIDDIIQGRGFDYRITVQAYSQKISTLIDLDPLEQVITSTAQQVLQAGKATLFLVNVEERDPNLRILPVVGHSLTPPLILHSISPVAAHLLTKREILHQYDVDMLPQFAGIDPVESRALKALAVELFVPICSRGEVVGVLALSAKTNGDPYSDEDLALLTTLANQTGAVLANARLVDNLRRLNTQISHLNEELAEANRRLQEMDKIKSSFLGVITHELRSPFATIDMSVELLRRYGIENLSPEQRDQLQQIATGLKQARAMIDNLIAFATLLSKGEIRPVEVNLAGLVTNAILPLEMIAKSRKVTVATDIPNDLPTIQADPERISEAVFHLVQNAIKFNRPQGTVHVIVRAEKEEVIIEVEDTGVGVPADKLASLWESFIQMADPLRRGVEGLGIGLALVKYVATAHGGRVWAQSVEGQGSTFGFSLPLKPPETKALPPGDPDETGDNTTTGEA